MRPTALAAWTAAIVVGSALVVGVVLRQPWGPSDKVPFSDGVDAYSTEHFAVGMLLYVALALTPWSLSTRLLTATAIHATWEIAENTDVMIRMFNRVTAAKEYGYRGDSVLNSTADNLFALLGFGVAHLLPWQAALALAGGIQLFNALTLRDHGLQNVVDFVRGPAAGR